MFNDLQYGTTWPVWYERTAWYYRYWVCEPKTSTKSIVYTMYSLTYVARQAEGGISGPEDSQLWIRPVDVRVPAVHKHLQTVQTELKLSITRTSSLCYIRFTLKFLDNCSPPPPPFNLLQIPQFWSQQGSRFSNLDCRPPQHRWNSAATTLIRKISLFNFLGNLFFFLTEYYINLNKMWYWYQYLLSSFLS